MSEYGLQQYGARRDDAGLSATICICPVLCMMAKYLQTPLASAVAYIYR